MVAIVVMAACAVEVEPTAAVLVAVAREDVAAAVAEAAAAVLPSCCR